MSEGVFLLPRIAPATDTSACKQFIRTTAFGPAGVLISATAGRLYQLTVVNASATRYFFQVHDKATAPLATEVPAIVRSLPVSGELVLDFGLAGWALALGIGIAISTTAGTLTFPAGADAGFANALFAART